MPIKIAKLPLLLMVVLFTSFLGVLPAKADSTQQTMLWEMRPNESLIELAAMFYPKSVTMQRVFIAKTQQLNQDTQVYANANTRYPTATEIVIPTLKSLSVRGVGAKKQKRSTKVNQSKASTQDAQQLLEKKESIDEKLVQENTKLKALEEQVKQMKQQLDEAKIEPAAAPAVKSMPIKKSPVQHRPSSGVPAA